MNKFFIILLHTYVSKLKSKSFIITTALTLLLVIGTTNIENIINAFDKGETINLLVIDETDELFVPFQQQIHLIEENMDLTGYEGTLKDAESEVLSGQYEGVLVMTYNEEGLPSALYKAMSITNSDATFTLEQAMQSLKIAMASANLGLNPDQIQKLFMEVDFEKIAMEENAKTEEELDSARGLVYILLFMIYIAVIMYASMIAMEVATEKSSRVMEILISSVSPVQQMFGKILGVALVSITQFALILIVGFQSFKRNLQNADEGIFQHLGFHNIPVSTVIYAGVFFLLGYLLFATLAAVLGSLVSRIEDVQQMITPMTLLIVVAFMIAMFGLSNPENTFITISSFFPFFTPMIMFLRVGMLTIPTWEIIVSIGILIGTIIALALVGARIYKGGVLLYGKSSSFKDLKKAFQLTKKA
jgi:ABC-2 type transport system permease protein